MSPRRVPFVKGHGTGNDFVILDNLDGQLSVPAATVAALCDRRRGLGADGVLLVSRTEAHPEVRRQAADGAQFFMDYRNADGSVAQMCGNGARVFVAHLLSRGLVEPGGFVIATRGGPRRVEVEAVGADVVVDMGRPDFIGAPVEVSVPGWGGPRPAVGVLMPNPHAVTWVEDVARAGGLLDAPAVTPTTAFPEGVNVEFVRELAEDHLQMRVFERGVGETLSCGTGACAAAVASLRRAGRGPGAATVRVDVPGGTVRVDWTGAGSVRLAGPAEMVASGWIEPGWWDRHG